MKLYDYIELMPPCEELTVWDSNYDMETYFYGGQPESNWEKTICDLSKLLTITEIRSNGVVVNLSDVIEKHIDEIAEHDLFYQNDIDFIMEGIETVLAGRVSDVWMQNFVEILKG